MITRREIAFPVGFGAASFLLAPLAARPVDTLAPVTSLASAFYSTSNAGHWGTLSNLLSDHVELRTNSGYFVETPGGGCKGDKDCIAVVDETVPPVLQGAELVVDFLRKRQQERNWFWMFGQDQMNSPKADFIVSFANPWLKTDSCKGPLCSPPDFVHCFWADVQREGGVAVSSRIGAIYEIELMNLGRSNG